ncbi:tripartite tricarboxylate transporter TctB family protein [Metallumcola ferriviriculae]|uniref:Tripartite tricarboxylate transporter TctB family protein n=1 Tax=Metallumcola ferriviriculae TaxID=3039180 RepID=A0AAU0UIM1_9FIRM|nr:tripartite tricarboxylate transporter TctB family protein [Desulfitibacteraceae bacterium MK1]
MKLKNSEIVSGVMSIGIALWFILKAQAFPDSLNKADVGPAAFPVVTAVLVIIFATSIIIKAVIMRTDDYSVTIKRGKNILASIIVILLYVALLPHLGFYIATAIAFPILLLLASESKLKMIITVTLVFEAFAFFIFETMLKVPLP